jgi:hypothetical protein
MSAFAGFTKNAARAAGNPNPMGTKQIFLFVSFPACSSPT